MNYRLIKEYGGSPAGEIAKESINSEGEKCYNLNLYYNGRKLYIGEDRTPIYQGLDEKEVLNTDYFEPIK